MKKWINYLLYVTMLVSSQAYAYDPYQVFRQGRIDLNLETNFFKSQANFNANGEKKNLSDDNYFQNFDFTPSVRYEFFDGIGFMTGLNLAASESSDPFVIRKNSTANRVDLGMDYLFWNSDRHEAFFRFMYSHALEKTAFTTDSVSNSDGANEIKPEMIVRFNLDSLYSYLQAGLNYRSEGLSMLATYAAGIEARFTEIGIGASLIGRATIKDDDKTSVSTMRDAVNNRVNAGSKKYFAVNPNSTDIELNVNFSANENLLFKVFGGYTLLGSNSAVGYNAGITLNFNFGILSPKPSSHRKNKKNENDHLNTVSRDVTPSDFKEDTNDGVNQDYFKPVKPIKKEYINQVEGNSENLRNATTPDDELEEIQIQKKLINPEYKVKLKKKTKLKKRK